MTPEGRILPHVLNAVSLAGFVLMIHGVAALAPWPTLMGIAVVPHANPCFADRMVRLPEDTRKGHS